jgi:Tfp pilus assembly protein PilV
MTLTEVLVAGMILSVALLVFLGCLVAAQRTSTKADYYSIAARAAGDKIVECQARGFSALADGTTTSALAALPQGQITVLVAPLDNNAANTTIKQVQVTVSWGGLGGGSAKLAGQVQASTLVSQVKTS